MRRYNIFNRTHKALRALLYDTALCLQQTDFTDEVESTEALNRLTSVLELLGEHANIEDKFILPAVEPYEPGIVATFNYEYSKELQLSKWIVNAAEGFDYLQTDDEREEAGVQVTNKFSEYLAFNLKQMAKEENVLNKILWNYYTDENLRTLENTIAQYVTEDLQIFVAKWMMRGMNKTEIITWMKSIERNATCKVCETLLEMAETELSEHRFRHIEASLTEGSLVA